MGRRRRRKTLGPQLVMSEGKETVTILPLIAARLKEERGKCEAQSKKRDLNRKSESLGDQDVRKGNERRRSDDI
jgi:hypothetical protein